MISWYPGIKSGSYFQKNFEGIPKLLNSPDGKGYMIKGKLHTNFIHGAKIYENFGEAVFLLMDKDSKSKMLPHKKKRKKTKPDYKQQQIQKWNKKVNDLQMAVDWLDRIVIFWNIQKEKPSHIKWKLKMVFIKHWSLESNKKQRKN